MLAAAVASGSGGATEAVKFRVEGGDEALEDTLKSASGLLQAEAAAKNKPAAQDLFAAARAEYARLIAALYSEGYYSPVIHVLIDGQEAAGIAPIDVPSRIDKVVVTVDPGPIFAFSRAEVHPLAPRSTLPPEFKLGAPAKSGLIQEAVAGGINGWRDRGHAKAEVAEQHVVADHGRNTLSADIELSAGPKLRFGPLTITGAQKMREERIRAIAGLPEGETFSPEEVRKANERLRRSGVFSSVTLSEGDRIVAPDLLPMDLTVVEQKKRRFGFGAEIASTSGLELTGFWLHRNLFGGGERLRIDGTISGIDASVGGVDYELGATLSRPATFTPDTTLSFGANVARLNEPDYQGNSASVDVGLQHIFGPALTGSIGIGYDYLKGNDENENFLYEDVSFPIGAIWDKRDNVLNPQKGFYVNGLVSPFIGFGETDSGGQITFDGRAYRGFGGTRDNRRVVLAGRVQVGEIVGASLLGTPRDMLFYSGGGGTVRGQPYQSLGVTTIDDQGRKIRTGGAQFLGASVEVRTMVTENIGIVGFADFGQISSEGFTDQDAQYQSGAGIGVRYNTSVGPVRLDIAGPMAGDTGDGVQFYLGLGQAF